MTTAASADMEVLQFSPRQRDRRLGIGDVLMALTRAMADRTDTSGMRDTFEQVLARVVPVRSVTIRDAGKWGRADSIESVSLEIPGMPPSAPALLEACFDPGARLGEWDFQVLTLAAHVGAMVLEVERARMALARAGFGPPTKVKRDGAAPLIGSSPVMQALRARIERVAATDFTVLLEGPGDPQ